MCLQPQGIDTTVIKSNNLQEPRMTTIERRPAAHFRLNIEYKTFGGQTRFENVLVPFATEPSDADITRRAKGIVADLTGQPMGRGFVNVDAKRIG